MASRFSRCTSCSTSSSVMSSSCRKIGSFFSCSRTSSLKFSLLGLWLESVGALEFDGVQEGFREMSLKRLKMAEKRPKSAKK